MICSGCSASVDLAQPLPLEGWQVIHTCAGQVIEAMPAAAGGLAWAWRSNQGTSED